MDFTKYLEGVLYYCVGDGALTQVSKRVCRVSLPEDFQKPPGHGCGQPALGEPAGGLDQMTSRGAFQSQPLCDSVILVTVAQAR